MTLFYLNTTNLAIRNGRIKMNATFVGGRGVPAAADVASRDFGRRGIKRGTLGNRMDFSSRMEGVRASPLAAAVAQKTGGGSVHLTPWRQRHNRSEGVHSSPLGGGGDGSGDTTDQCD